MALLPHTEHQCFASTLITRFCSHGVSGRTNSGRNAGGSAEHRMPCHCSPLDGEEEVPLIARQYSVGGRNIGRRRRRHRTRRANVRSSCRNGGRSIAFVHSRDICISYLGVAQRRAAKLLVSACSPSSVGDPHLKHVCRALWRAGSLCAVAKEGGSISDNFGGA